MADEGVGRRRGRPPHFSLAFVGHSPGLLAKLLLCTVLLFTASASAEPKRIISTAPSITEMLFALGLGPRVAGVTNFCTYPPEAASKPKIGGYTNPSVEAILALRPDLVALLKDPTSLATRLRGMGLNAVELDHRDVYSIDGIYNSIGTLGSAAGVPERASELVSKIRGDLDSVRAKTAKLPRRRVMFLVGRTPKTLEGLIVVGRGSFINEVIEIAGGENIFRDAVASYPKVSIEEILGRNPDIIIDMGDVARAAGITETHKKSVVALWGRYPALKAVRQGGVFAVAEDALVVAGPRAGEAARIFARMIHPEAGF
jgi:iron complex transport system substrate-binding protein